MDQQGQDSVEQTCARLSSQIRVLINVYRQWVNQSRGSINDLAALNWFLYQLLDEFANKTKPNCCRLAELEQSQSYRYEVFRRVVDRLGLPNITNTLATQIAQEGLEVPTSIEHFLTMMFTVCNEFKKKYGGSGSNFYFFQRKGFRSFTVQLINDITRLLVRISVTHTILLRITLKCGTSNLASK